MPSTSKAQAKLFRAVAHSRAFSKRAGVPMSVAKHFLAADKSKGKKWQARLPARKGR
jgi:hypothetical protein